MPGFGEVNTTGDMTPTQKSRPGRFLWDLLGVIVFGAALAVFVTWKLNRPGPLLIRAIPLESTEGRWKKTDAVERTGWFTYSSPDGSAILPGEIFLEVERADKAKEEVTVTFWKEGLTEPIKEATLRFREPTDVVLTTTSAFNLELDDKY